MTIGKINDLKQITLERQIINQSIRAFFSDRGFVEVETPIIVASPGMEPNLSPFETVVSEPDGKEHKASLITSPEYSMKKLLGSGMEKIFTITKVFRNEEEFGGNHNPEFSMLEWYKQGGDYKECMGETRELIRVISTEAFAERRDLEDARSLDSLSLARDDKWERTSVRDLFQKFADINLDSDDLKEACNKLDIRTIQDDTESDLFYRIFLSKIEPNISGNTFVFDYPKYQAALARLTPDKNYGERFELYMNGLEICNGFTELTDADEQRRRFEQEAEERRALGKTVHPIDEELLKLLPSIQNPTYGNALGIDRLHMVLTERSSINDVLAFPVSKLLS